MFFSCRNIFQGKDAQRKSQSMSIDKEFLIENKNQLFLQMLFNHLFCDAQNLWKTCQYFIANVSYGECYYFNLSYLITKLNLTLSDCYAKLIFTFYSNLFRIFLFKFHNVLCIYQKETLNSFEWTLLMLGDTLCIHTCIYEIDLYGKCMREQNIREP